MLEKDSTNTLRAVESPDSVVVMIDKETKDCDEQNLFELFKSHFLIFFFDIEEIRFFVRYLKENKSKTIVKDLLEKFSDNLKEYRERDLKK